MKNLGTDRETIEELIKHIKSIKIEDLGLVGYDNHEFVGFELAKAYILDKTQNFEELKKELYKKGV